MHTAVVILAAGHGKRLGSPMPKVLAPVGGKPMVAWVVDAVLKSGVTDRPVMVVGAGADTVRAALGEGCDYVTQDQQLGTGHAVAQCRDALEGKAEVVLVLYGDMPLVTSATIRRLVDAHAKGNAVLTMATVTVPDFDGWRQSFASFGRIVRDGAGQLQRIVELRDATPQERLITEVNPSLLCFQASWLWPALTQLTNRNAQGEYYLTDLLALAMSQGQRVESLPVEPREAMGVNDAQQLEMIRQFAAT